jgi:DNA-binding SARP family transcriptional activator
LEVLGSGGRIDLGVRKARLLFGALAVQAGTPVTVDALGEILWPERRPSAWEANLHAHVSRLRRALDPERSRGADSRLVTHGQSYVLRLEPHELDVRRFEQLAAAGRAALARSEAGAAATLLADATAQWRGPVLADFANEPFVSAVARHLDELRVVTVAQRIEAELAAGRDAVLVGELEALVQAHPLREELWQLLMLALYRTGRQSDALRRFAEVRTILVEELGIEPGPALRNLERSILEHDPTLTLTRDETATAPVATPKPAAWLEPPPDGFVGRRRELDTIIGAAPGATGRRMLLLVEGEPGVGKTRLVREAVTRFCAMGMAVVGGRCSEEPLHAFQPLAEAVERLSGTDASRDPARTILAAIAPGAEPSGMPIADAEAMQYALFRALSETLVAERLGGPPVLVLDDLQWASSEALRVLAHLLRDDDAGDLLVLATARDTELSPALDALVAELARDGRIVKVALDNLTPSEVGDLVGARGTPADVDELFELTEGNPFYVEQVLRHVAESGGRLDESAVPDSVRDTIARRMLRFPDATRRLLGIAAVIGPEFALTVLAAVGNHTEDEVDELLAPAVATRVISEHVDRVGSYAFTHALIRHALLDGLGAARTTRVHRSIARAFEALPARDAYAAEIAFHYLAASADGSDPLPGVQWARVAAERANARFAYLDAVIVLARADSVLEATPHDPGAAYRCELLIELAAAQDSGGLAADRAATLERAYLLAQDASSEMCARVVVEGFGPTTLVPEEWHIRARDVFARLVDGSTPHTVLAALLAFAEESEPGPAAQTLAALALERCPSLPVAERGVVLAATLRPLMTSQTPAQSVAHAQAVVDAAMEGGMPGDRTTALSGLRQALLSAGDLDRSDAVAREYEALAEKLRIPRYLAGVEQRRAMRALLSGRFADAEAHATEAVALQPIPEYFEGLAVQLFAIRFEQGRLLEVRDAVSEFAATARRPAWQLGEAMLLAEIGETEHAQAVLAPFVETKFATVPHDPLWFAALACAANAAARLADHRAAVIVTELLRPHVDRVIVLGEGAVCWGSVHRLLGPLASLLGAKESAIFHHERAARVHEQLGALPFLAYDRLGLAEILFADAPRSDVAVELARTGVVLARRFDQRSLLKRYEALPA